MWIKIHNVNFVVFSYINNIIFFFFMQKIGKRASILIWAIFLSLIISVSFVSISTKINKNIRSNSKNIKTFNNQKAIKEKIKEGDFTNQRLANNEAIIFSKNNSLTWSLKKSDNIKLKFEQISTIDINILSGWPIYFTLTWSTNSWWIVSSTSNLSSFSWELILENLWWYTMYNIDSNNDFLSPELNYKIVKKIWNKQVIKNSGIIKTDY